MTRFLKLTVVAALLVAGCAAPEPVTLRVLSYNIHHGEGMDGRLDLERIARVIRDSGADLVALQEVDRGAGRTVKVDQPARLAELTGMRAVFEKNIDFDGGEYGNAILSRLPIESHRNHLLPQLKPGEQRGMLETRVLVGRVRLLFCGTHFDYRRADDERLASAELVRQFVEEHAEVPIIVAGDLNTPPDGPVMPEMFGFLVDTCPPGRTDALTFPADGPDRRIDYILFSRHPAVRVVDYRVVGEEVASDHRPITATLSIRQDDSAGPQKRGRR